MPETGRKIENELFGVGITTAGNDALFFYRTREENFGMVNIDSSGNGVDFHPFLKNAQIRDEWRRTIRIDRCKDFRIGKTDKGYFLCYKLKSPQGLTLYGAVSRDFTHWKRMNRFGKGEITASIIPGFKLNGTYFAFIGGSDLKLARSQDLKKWSVDKTPILDMPSGRQMIIGGVFNQPEGIILAYFEKFRESDGKYRFAINTAIFNQSNPANLLWKSEYSIWEQPDNWYSDNLAPLGIIQKNKKLVSYWELPGKGVYAVIHAPLVSTIKPEKQYSFGVLKRLKENPILKPITGHFWESKATFNPAAVYEGGKVHLVYRAIGDHDMSVLGYATTSDGVNIDERLEEPIYVPTQPFEFTGSTYHPKGVTSRYPPGHFSPYASGGGGYGGCEDPRLTKIGNKYFMTYVAYDGSGPPRVALSSISENDFKNRNWSGWETPVLITKPGVVDKNCVIFPEKINGKYVIMHRVFPHILVDFVDSLDFDGNTFLEGKHKIGPRRTAWDSRKVGAGAPPIKTPYGWLLIYHSVGEQDGARYKMGAMLLDTHDPTKVIARSNMPILEPQAHYENEGMKYGVAYPCGAVNMDGKLMVYYGGADMVVCAAEAPMNKFMDELVTNGSTRFEEVNIRKVYE